jgi:hypothetical protein
MLILIISASRKILVHRNKNIMIEATAFIQKKIIMQTIKTIIKIAV